MDVLLMTTGAGLTSVGIVFGFLLGRVARRTTSVVDDYVCQCRHAFSFHDDRDRCHGGQFDYNVDAYLQCTCRRYVGPRPPVDVDPADVLRQLRGDD